MRKLIATTLSLALLLTFVSCTAGGSGSDTAATGTEGDASAQAVPDAATPDQDQEPVTLKIVGCGAFSASGPDGTLDAITGREIPGYNMIVEAWNELYPHVTLEIEAYPWDNWQASIQTAVLAGGVDVIMHGATLTDLVIPLNDLIAADPEFDAQRLAYSTRRSESLGSLENVYITGVPVTVAPMLVIINKDILANYGVDLPEADWTWNDFLEIAEACTGTDPVTGQQTYGLQFHNSHSDNEIWKNFANLGYGLGLEPIVRYGSTAKESAVDYTGEDAMKVWNFINEMAKYTSPADREGIDPSKPEADFDIAMYFTETTIKSYQQLTAAGVLDMYTVQNLPVVASGELQGVVTPYCGDSNLAICNTSENVDWAWEFIKFCSSNEAAIQYYIGNGEVTNNMDKYAELDMHLSDEWITAIESAMANIPETYSPASGLYTNNISFGNLNATIGSSMRMLIMGTGDVETAASNVQSVVEEYLAAQS